MAGLRLVAWDGTQLDVPASPANDAVFVPARSRKGGVAAFGKVRLLTLIEVGTHAVIDAVFGTESEQALASRLASALRSGMLLLGDRNFPSWRLWTQCADTGAHLLWRVKASRLLPRLATFPGPPRTSSPNLTAEDPVQWRPHSPVLVHQAVELRSTHHAVEPVGQYQRLIPRQLDHGSVLDYSAEATSRQHPQRLWSEHYPLARLSLDPVNRA